MTKILVDREVLERLQKALTVQPDGKFDRANWTALHEELRALLDAPSEPKPDCKCPMCGHEQNTVEVTCNNCGRNYTLEEKPE
jgi:hypothetical protein